ncbi:MAG: hypothetical protein V4466_05555 [Pseudomonadota bacterium]
MTEQETVGAPAESNEALLAWERPQMTRLETSEAEAGATPGPDGFTFS